MCAGLVMKDATAESHKRSKTHRRELTAAETVLWQELRRKQIGGYHFRRQVPIGPYFVDFACVKEKLIIEVDGIGHAEPHEIAHDAKRTDYLNQLGWRVARYMNVEVFDETHAVVESIWHHLKSPEFKISEIA
jgi:very-short-patch-repair endonuclease